MTADVQSDQLPDLPYPGIEPFNYARRKVFFARDKEARSLMQLIAMYRGVLLYSDSGTGKSSLVNAGLIPLAVDRGFQPERIRVQPRRGEEIIVERLSERVDDKRPFLPSIFASDEQHERVVVSVEEFEKTLHQPALAARPLLVFDQFEEWITLFEEGSRGEAANDARIAQKSIREAIVSLINDRKLRVKVLIVLREDYLAKLDPLFEQCPSLPDQYLRLTALSGNQVYRAIRGPFEEHPGRYWVEVSPTLAKKIRAQFEERSEGADVHLTEVQIVCQSLFEAGRRGQKIDQYFTDEGGVQGILERYLKRALESLSIDQQEPAVALLTRMLTSAGTRNVISEDDLLNRVENEDRIPRELLGKTLQSLEQETKLVRRERRREVYYYEIASEFLVGWIQKKARERQRLVEQRKLEEAQRRAEEQAGIARRFGRLTATLAVVSLLAVAFAVIAIHYYRGLKIASEDLSVISDHLKVANEKLNTLRSVQEFVYQVGIQDLKKNPDPETRQFAKGLEAEMQQLNPSLSSLEDLGDLIKSHNEALNKFSVCYLLDDTPTAEAAEKFSQLYHKLKDLDQLKPFFDETTSKGKNFKELKGRIQTLKDIRYESELERLVEIAETAGHIEAVYATWIRLGEFPWPSKKKDLDRDKKIQGTLKIEFEKIKSNDEARGNFLLQILGRIGLQREIIWCNRISIVPITSGGKFKVALRSKQLRDKFVPINTSNKRPMEVDQNSNRGLLREDFVEDKYKLDSPTNAGWPKYIASTNDPSVILMFIPAGTGNPEPFYMATQEVTNAQYRLFLENTPAARPRTVRLSTLFTDQNNNVLICSRKYEDPVRACKIRWDGKSFNVTQGSDDIPVTWVTYIGAQSYAKWLGGQLPTALQHEYSCRADTDNIHPWGNNLSEIASFAHVRGGHWRAAADDYNNTLINSGEVRTLITKKAPAPAGAKPEDFVLQKTLLESAETVHDNKAYGSAWPIDHAEKTNGWDLYDMIGNVWEWCQDGTQSVICGGSCLAPPEYVLLTDPSDYSVEFNKDKTACDVGFRVVVPAR